MGWGAPSEEAIKVAMIKDDQTKYPIFAYEAGAKMPHQVAPAKRVGFFLNNNTKGSITSEGWSLFNAAVDWAVNKDVIAAKSK